MYLPIWKTSGQIFSAVNIILVFLYKDMKTDYFEIERVIEELAKNYAAPCTTTWFKVSNNKNPSTEQYREKVVEFMKQFEAILSGQLPVSEQSKSFLQYAKKLLYTQISLIRRGNNKEVERRFQYYVNYK